jgi:hypothetical protein
MASCGASHGSRMCCAPEPPQGIGGTGSFGSANVTVYAGVGSEPSTYKQAGVGFWLLAMLQLPGVGGSDAHAARAMDSLRV